MSTTFFVLAENLPLGLQVRLLRIRYDMRQADLAQAAGVTQADVSDLECGRTIPYSRKLRILSAVGLEDGGRNGPG